MIADEERKAVLDVLSGPILVHGPRATEFEAEFARIHWSAPRGFGVFLHRWNASGLVCARTSSRR